MERLTAREAGSLRAEDADVHVSLAVGGLAVMEGPAPGHASIVSTMAKRVGIYPRLAQRPLQHAFALRAPEWVADPDFDVAHHVRRVALPFPGGDEELCRVTADLMAVRLDRDRPPWEIWVIEGLSDNRWAMLIKIHQCMADGITASHMFEGLCDDGVSYSLAHRIRAAREALHPNGVGAGPLQLAHSLWKASATVASAATLVARGAVELGVDLVFPTSRSALDGPASSLRRYSTARVPMHDIAQVCQRFDVTVNDVVLAAITESYRAMMIDRGERPRRESLRTLLPVSMGSVQAPQLIDDAVSLMLADLPVDEGNLVQRLRAVHSRLDDTAPRGGGSTTRLPHQDVAATVTPVPGPRQQLHLMGRTVLSLFPIAPIATNLRTGIAILSYADDLFFGVFADYDTVPEVDTVAHGIELAVARLVSCSRHPSTPQTPERPKTPRDPHKLTSLGTG